MTLEVILEKTLRLIGTLPQVLFLVFHTTGQVKGKEEWSGHYHLNKISILDGHQTWQ